MIIKDKSIEAYIRANNIDIGDIGSRFIQKILILQSLKLKFSIMVNLSI